MDGKRFNPLAQHSLTQGAFDQSPLQAQQMAVYHQYNHHVRETAVALDVELIDAGYLAQLKYVQVDGFDTGQLKLNSTGADFTDASVRRYYQRINFTEKMR